MIKILSGQTGNNKNSDYKSRCMIKVSNGKIVFSAMSYVEKILGQKI